MGAESREPRSASFLSTESAGAVAMLVATVAALLWANSPWSDSYESVWTTTLSIRLGGDGISLELREWVNSGLMTFYFLVVGLEAKRELDLGALRERRRIVIPVVAALGGMTIPVLIFLALNAGGPGAHGWGAAMSTDTAFALGVLALLAPRATRLRIYLLTLAVFDDLVALLVIATVYTEDVSFVPLAAAIGLFGVLLALRFAPVAWRGPVAVIVGAAVWGALLKSGIDPVISGLAVGLVTGAYPPVRTDLERVTELTRSFREQPTPELARSAQLGVASAISANDRIQYRLHPWTSFVIVPLFALANAGIHIDGELLRDAATSPVTMGILFGYVLGKPIGIVAGTWLGSRRWLGGLRPPVSRPVLLGGGAVAGIGFTVSLLIATIAFEGQTLDEAKLGVLGAAILAPIVAWAVFRMIARLPECGSGAPDQRDGGRAAGPRRRRRSRARPHPRLGRARRSRSSSTATTNARTAARRRSSSASCSTRSATSCATSGGTSRSTTSTRTPRWRPRPPRRRRRRARSGRCTTGCSPTRTTSPGTSSGYTRRRSASTSRASSTSSAIASTWTA